MGSVGTTRAGVGNVPSDPGRFAKINERFIELTGFTLSEAISEVRSVISDMDDEYTADYLKEQLSKMVDGTIKMRDIKEVADTALR